MDLFADGERLCLPDLAARREAALGRDLDNALLRIAELEAEGGGLRRELAVLGAELDAALRRIGEVLATRDPFGRFPAAAAAALLERLTVVQRRDAWLGALARAGLGGAIFGLGPHGGGGDPLAVLIAGSGGIGDALYLSTLARALHQAFPAPRIIVLHDHPAAPELFAANPFVLDTVVLRDAAREEFLDHCHGLDVFDLVADVRYVVSYAAPPLSRIPPDFLRAAHARAAPWQRFVRFDWPHRNNALAREAAAQGMGKLDLLGFTANLAVDRHLAPDLFDTAPPPDADPLAPLAGRAYATIHHGSAANMAGDDGLQTKNLSLAQWGGIAAGLSAAGYAVVQLGAAAEGAVPGIDLDLRGATDLAATARALQHASLHVDTEGGLVHLARARRTPSIVLFGPTPPGFFGYPGNANLAPAECGDCWWVTRDWSRSCPLGEPGPPCMRSHDAAAVLAALPGLVRAPAVIRLAPPAPLGIPTAPAEAGLVAGLAGRLEGLQGAALLLDSLDLLAACLAAPAIRAAAPRLLVPPALHAAAVAVAGDGAAPEPASPGFIPADAGAFPAAFAVLAETPAAGIWLALAAELRRVAAPGAPAGILMAGMAPAPAALAAAAAAMPGGRVRFVLAGGGESRSPGPSAIDLSEAAEAASARAGLPLRVAGGGGA